MNINIVYRSQVKETLILSSYRCRLDSVGFLEKRREMGVGKLS